MNEVPSDAVAVLARLRERHNVLISGPPATGKSLLLGEVARWFQASTRPPHTPMDAVPFPLGAIQGLDQWLPSPERYDRRVFRIIFHQGTKFRDWLRGLVPVPGTGAVGFKVTDGVFHQALAHANTADGASLVVVDELNRGPAVQIFGDSIVAMESDKRLDRSGNPTTSSAPMRVLDDAGDYRDVYVSFHLYMVAAMNRADTSVEPLDVAFLRRWEPYLLLPDEGLAASHLALGDARAVPPDDAATATDVYLALHRTWRAVNRRIALARGAEYQLGHGVLMWSHGPLPMDRQDAFEYAAVAWRRIKDHVDELFFGDARTMAAVLNANKGDNPFRLESGLFADAPVNELVGPSNPAGTQLYRLLRIVGEE